MVKAHIAALSSNISPFPPHSFGICFVLPLGEDASHPLGDKLQIQNFWVVAEGQRMPRSQRGRADSCPLPKDEDHQTGSKGSIGSWISPDNEWPRTYATVAMGEEREEQMKSFLGSKKLSAGLVMSPWHAKVSKCPSTFPGCCEPIWSLTYSENFPTPMTLI